MKVPGARPIHINLSQVFGDDCYIPAAIECWLARFREGDLSCADHPRSGRPVIDISECLLAFLNKFPFASANMMSKHFRIAHGIIKEHIQRDLELKNSPVDGRHISSARHKTLIVSIVLELYCTYCMVTSVRFRGNDNRRRVLVSVRTKSDPMFAPSAYMVLPRLRAGFQVKKRMITVFFTATRLIVLNSLPQG
jgi:hypothetical protein